MSGTPLPETDAIFARAYADAVKSTFGIVLGDDHFILTSPMTQRGVAAGDLIYPQMTNYLIYKFADALQYSENPSYTGGSAGSYLQQLRSYLDWVKTTRNPSQVVVARMARARDNATNANINYFNVLEAAQVEWIEVRDNFPTLDFWGWADGHYPQLKQATDIRTRADKELHHAMELYFGPEGPILSGYMTTLGNAFNSSVSMPGLNQEGLINDQTLINKATDYANSGQKPPNTDITQSTVLVPAAYTIPNYTSTVQSWITAGGHGSARDTIIPLDINAGKTTTWADYGFKEVHGGGGFGFWPFFHAEVMVNNERVERMLATIGREDAISLQAAMIGVQKFDIQPGTWDIPDIKTQFPDRLPAAPDVLSSKVATKIVSVLVGYDLELRVQFAPEIRAEVDSIYEEVKATKGRMSIFGFHVSAGEGGNSPDHVETRFEDVRWDKANGSMVLVPTTGQVYPTILGALAQRFT